MTYTKSQLFSLSILFLCACGSDKAPIPVGLQYEANITTDLTSTYYRLTEGEDPIESVGVLGNAPNCLQAQVSAGQLTSVVTEEQQILGQVIGSTELSHPLVPNSDEFSNLQASIIQEREQLFFYGYTQETVYEPTSETPMSEADYRTYQNVTYVDSDITTKSDYHGVAVDEYAVEFDLNLLWSDFEEVSPSSVRLLFRDNPEIGDVWVSTSGNTLYVYQGIEPITLGGVAAKAHKVKLYETASVKPNGGAIFDQCINRGLEQLSTDDANTEQYSYTTLFLDAGCEGNFTHTEVGTQWWYNYVLVKEEVVATEVEILDYGFEYYEDQAEGNCIRKTTVSDQDPSIQMFPFVEYKVTIATRTRGMTSWSSPQ